MKINQKKLHKIFATVFAIFAFALVHTLSSCSPSCAITIFPQGELQISVQNKASDELNSLIQSLFQSGLNGNSSDQAPVLTEEDFSQLMLQDAKFSIANTVDFSLECKLEKNALSEEILKITPEKKTIILSWEPSFLLGQVEADENLQDIMELLMAPVYTQEEISSEEYLEAIASFYGKKISEKFRKSVLTIKIDAPSAIKNCTIKEDESLSEKLNAVIKHSGKTATIEIPIYRLLSINGKTSFIILL